MKSIILLQLLLGLLLIGQLRCSSVVQKKHVQQKLTGEKKGFIRNKLLSKFQSFKNFIRMSIPTKMSGPVLYKPYLNFNPENVPLRNPDGPFSFPTTFGNRMRPEGKTENLIHHWKQKKKEKIKKVKDALFQKEESEAEILAQRLAQEQMEILKQYHMHGIVDTYRPPPATSNWGYGWSESSTKRNKKKKIKKKKAKRKKTKKKKAKKQKKKKQSGWHSQGATNPPKRKKVKVKTKTKGWGWGNDRRDSNIATEGPLIPSENLFGGQNILPAGDGGRKTPNKQYGYHRTETSSYKVSKKRRKKAGRTKKQRQNSRQKTFQRRTLLTLPRSEKDRHASDSLKVVNEHNFQQRHRFGIRPRVPVRGASLSIKDAFYDDEYHLEDGISMMLEPGHELQFRKMPFIFEDFHHDIYAAFR